MKIGIILRKGRPEPAGILKDLLPWLDDRGAEVYMEDREGKVPGVKTCAMEEMPSLVEAVVVLGGDGTMLGAARLMAEKGIPLLGVNLGGLGFITEVHKGEIYDALEKILSDECLKEKRMMLQAQVLRDGKVQAEFTALNDIVVNKTLAKIIDLETSISGAYVTHFKADGLIVATPTGSTAYSLSANGPILYPTLHGIVLTPICPHTLTNRPIVLADDVEIEITLKSESEGVLLTHDGLVGFTMMKGDKVVIKKSPHATTLLMPCDRDHFLTLRQKLKWGER
jgi:NAD+ kinase